MGALLLVLDVTAHLIIVVGSIFAVIAYWTNKRKK